MSSERRILSSAPGRAGIIGNPTDMYGGSVLSCSVGMRARVEITPAKELILESNGESCRIHQRRELRPQHDVFDVARAVLDYLRLPELKCKITYQSEIPLRSGLAGATALVVALLQGILAWMDKPASSYRLAEMARYVELHHLKVVCGYQDAYMCTFGGLNYMDFRGKQFYREEEAELFATIEPISSYVVRLPFLLGFTGVQHSSGAVHKPLRERWLEGDPPVVKGYRRITEIARLGKKALLTEDWPTFGDLMNENHAIQRDLGGSGEANERLITAALEAGALGAKLAGTGDGGTVITLWPNADASTLVDALHKAGAHTTYPLDMQMGAAIEAAE